MRITLNLITHAAPENVVAFRGDGVSGHALAARWLGADRNLNWNSARTEPCALERCMAPPCFTLGEMDTAAYH